MTGRVKDTGLKKQKGVVQLTFDSRALLGESERCSPNWAIGDDDGPRLETQKRARVSQEKRCAFFERAIAEIQLRSAKVTKLHRSNA